MGLVGENKIVGGDLCDPLKVACYRARGTKGRWDLEEKKEP